MERDRERERERWRLPPSPYVVLLVYRSVFVLAEANRNFLWLPSTGDFDCGKDPEIPHRQQRRTHLLDITGFAGTTWD